MSKLNGYFERRQGRMRCRLRGSGYGPRSHYGRPDGRTGQPAVCGTHDDAEASHRRQIRNPIEVAICGRDCPVGPANATPGVLAGKIAEIVRPVVDEA